MSGTLPPSHVSSWHATGGFYIPHYSLLKGKGMTGRAKMRWVDGVDQDSETIGERYRRSQANDKDKWKSF
jgi:hypothetical protein